MTEQNATLVRVLAHTDGLFKPLRLADWAAPMPTNLYEHREKFASEGLAWHCGAATEADRKREQRTLESLALAGLLKLHGKERRTAVRLTDQGDILARAMAGMPNVDAAYRLLGEVIRLESRGDGYGPMASELWLATLADYSDSDACRRKLLEVQDAALPALCRGWLTTESDCFGHVWYFLTALGRKVAKKPAPTLPADLPLPDDSACEFYDTETIAFRNRLRSLEPENPREIGYLPLPASIDIRPRRNLRKASR